MDIASSSSQQDKRSTSEVFAPEDLPQPVLPWIASVDNVNRQSAMSTLSHNSFESTAGGSVHMMKRYTPEMHEKRRMRWPMAKWWILMANTLLFFYGLVVLILALLTFFKLYLLADVVIVGENTLLKMVTATGAVCLFTAMVGYVGIMLNNRAVLTFYNILLWLCFALIAAIGYTAYRKNKWNIEGKLSYQWHYGLTEDGRTRIQADLHCCGYKDFSDFHERSNKCYPRTILPGCRYKYTQFTRMALTNCWIAAFSMIPPHLFVMVTALLCSNHINRKFGKGLPPKIYRLDYQGIVAGTPTGSSHNLFGEGVYQRPPSRLPMAQA